MDIRLGPMHLYDLHPLIPTVGYSFGGHVRWRGELTLFVLWLNWGLELRLRAKGAPAPDEKIMELFDQVVRERARQALSTPAPQQAGE